MEERMEKGKEEMEEKMRKKEYEMEAKLVKKEAELRMELEKKEAVLRKEMETTESVLRKELASKEEIGRAVTPYLTLCVYQELWTAASSTITYDSFLTNFNNGDQAGGADGQLDLGTGVFTCLRDGIYRIDYSGYASLDPAESVYVSVYLNGVHVPESLWQAYTTSGTIGDLLQVPGSRSLVSVQLPVPPRLTLLLQMLPLQLGDTLELRTGDCTGGLYRLVLCIQLADQGLSARP